MLKTNLRRLLLCALVLIPTATSQSQSNSSLPSFDAATIKPPDPQARFHKAGFYGERCGRVFLGVNLKMLIQYAFDLQGYPVSGGPVWADLQAFEIGAVPSENSPSSNIKVGNAEPTAEQRLMLQSLLRDRFGLRFHMERKESEVYLLTRGSKLLQLPQPKDAASDPRAIIYVKQGDIADGEARGTNTSVDYLAVRLGRYLQLPVLNRTELLGSYDFYLTPNEPENHDLDTAVLGVVNRLGLNIKRGRGLVQKLIIDTVEQPTEN